MNGRPIVVLALALVAATATGAVVAPDVAARGAGEGADWAPATGPTEGDDGHSGSQEGTKFVHDGERITLQSGPGQVIEGRSDLPAGTDVTVRVRSTGEDPFLRSATTTVDDDGRFRAVVDLSDVQPGSTLEVVLHRNGSFVAEAAAEVVECTDACDDWTPSEPSAVLEGGDELALETAPGQAVRGETNLPAGTELDVRLRSSSAEAPFLKQVGATVGANGTFRAVFDLSDVEATVDVRIDVIYNGTSLTSASTTVECPDCGAEGTPATGDDGGATEYEGAEVGVIQVRNGSTARIPIALGAADAASLSVGGPETDYALEMTIRDGSGDGRVVVLFDTAAAAAGERPVRAADDGDRIEVRTHEGTFTATEYRLVLHPVDDGSETVATGLLVVAQDGGGDTPLFTPSPDSGPPLALGSVAALLVGGALAVLGLGSLLGIVDVRALLPGR